MDNFCSPWQSRYPQSCNGAIRPLYTDDFPINPLPTFADISFPPSTRTIVKEIASAKAIGFDLALLAFIPSIAAADRGQHRVVLSDGSQNTLSLIMLVGASSGLGKSRALEESLTFFYNWEVAEQSKIQAENKRRKLHNELLAARISELKRQFGKSFATQLTEEIQKLQDEQCEPLEVQPLLLGDVSASAYQQHLIKYNIAIRLESEGIQLPANTLQILNKAWSGESSRRLRISMPDGIMRDPFIVDLVMTQPDSFFEELSKKGAISSGKLARTLPYLYVAERFPPAQPPHAMNENIRAHFHRKLEELLNNSSPTNTETRKHDLIHLEPEAERLLSEYSSYVNGMTHCGNELSRMSDFAARMKQHALRLAAVIHLAEHELFPMKKIDANTMNIGIQMTNIFANHAFNYRINGYDDQIRVCCEAIMRYIYKYNRPYYPEVELKQAVKHRFKADDVNVALLYLLNYGYLNEVYQRVPEIKCAGRPKGREFIPAVNSAGIGHRNFFNNS